MTTKTIEKKGQNPPPRKSGKDELQDFIRESDKDFADYIFRVNNILETVILALETCDGYGLLDNPLWGITDTIRAAREVLSGDEIGIIIDLINYIQDYKNE